MKKHSGRFWIGFLLVLLGIALVSATFAVPPMPSTPAAGSASTTSAGLLEISTDAEAIARTATDKALVPSNLAALSASTTSPGILEISTDAEAIARTATDKALVPSNLAALQSYVATDGTDSHTIKAVQETGLGGRLTLGLDETARTLFVCDIGDINTDWTLAAQANPSIVIAHPSAAGYYSTIQYAGILAPLQYSITLTSALSSANFFQIVQNSSNDVLADTDDKQAWVRITPQVTQTGTAAFDGISLVATLNSVGDGSSGYGNNLIRAGTSATPDLFKVDTTGRVISLAEINGLVKVISLTTAEGTHDGATLAYLSDSGESWGTNAYVGMRLYNVTDGSSCIVTANAGTTMTCTLAGGTGNDWENGDAWAVAPGPGQSGSTIRLSSATTILHPSTAGYSACYRSSAAQIIKVDPQSGSMQIELDGTALTAGNEIDSDGNNGEYFCLINRSATYSEQWGSTAGWTDGGSS